MPILGAFIVPHPPLIVPQVGKGQESKIKKTVEAYREVARRIAALSPDTIILTTPHSTTYADYLHLSPGPEAEGNFKSFGAPEVRMAVTYDEMLVGEIARQAAKAGISAGTKGERNRSLDHGTMVPLYFIQKNWPDFQLVRIAISGMSSLTHYRFGQCVAQAVAELRKRVVIVASGDLSHKLLEDGPYGFSPDGPLFDQQVTQAMADGDFGRFLEYSEDFCESAAECGLRSFQILAGALDGRDIRSELLSYEGPFGVGYGIAAYEIRGENPLRRFGINYSEREEKRLAELHSSEDAFVRLARASLESYVNTRKRMGCPNELPEELIGRKAGVFVSLKMEGRLRGCIGTISPTTSSIAEEIIRNAIHAGTEDPRFDPVSANELSRLVYSVDVLGPAEPIASKAELDVKRYGVIVRHRGKSGLLLPHLEGVNTPEEQIAIACQKAGISERESYTLERFEVVRHY